jgi:hypothetical protein
MKKLVFIALLIGSILFVGCEKENESVTYTNISKDNHKEPKKLYRMLSCAYQSNGTDYSGVECALGAYEQCLAQADCQPIVYQGGWLPLPQSFPPEWGFTQEEENNWDDGNDIIENSDEFIENHYEFFLFMFESGYSLHPDTLMLYNE